MDIMFRSLFLRASIIRELFVFLWKEKIWWLIPLMVILILLAILMIFAHSSPVAPFIYTLF